MNLKDLSEELASYIADAERLIEIVEAFREIDNARVKTNSHLNLIEIKADAYWKLKALIDE